MAMGKDFRFLGRKEKSAEALEETGFRTRVWGETLPNCHSAAAIPFGSEATAIRQRFFRLQEPQPPSDGRDFPWEICRRRLASTFLLPSMESGVWRAFLRL